MVPFWWSLTMTARDCRGRGLDREEQWRRCTLSSGARRRDGGGRLTDGVRLPVRGAGRPRHHRRAPGALVFDGPFICPTVDSPVIYLPPQRICQRCRCCTHYPACCAPLRSISPAVFNSMSLGSDVICSLGIYNFTSVLGALGFLLRLSSLM